LPPDAIGRDQTRRGRDVWTASTSVTRTYARVVAVRGTHRISRVEAICTITLWVQAKAPDRSPPFPTVGLIFAWFPMGT